MKTAAQYLAAAHQLSAKKQLSKHRQHIDSVMAMA
jgi:hypothetical protein